MDRTTRWPCIAPDVVRDVAGRLHDARDFVRLHAVCKPWRGSHDAAPPYSRTTMTQFLPWLLAAADEDSSTALKFRCIFSKSSYRAPPPPLSVSPRICVGSAGATAVRYLTAEHGHASLRDPLTGKVTHVPQFPFCVDGQPEKHNPRGMVYRDGTVLLYGVSNTVSHIGGGTARFRAAILRPGDAKWKLVERTLSNDTPRRHGGFCAAYRDGRILILEDRHWRVAGSEDDDVLVRMPECNFPSHSNYVLESRGELLWVSVHAWITHTYEKGVTSPSRTFSVLVHALEEDDASAPPRMRWVRKGGRSLADRVLFLGSPNSLAMDASHLDGHGGCAYFVYYNHSKAMRRELFGVFRYNLVDGKTEFVERVPLGWDNQECTWLVPQPAIAPNLEITRRSREARERKQKRLDAAPVTSPTSIIHIWKHHEPSFRVMVANLPLTVNSSQLQLLFSKYGKVSDAKVHYFERTKRSHGFIGHLTMSTVHAHPEDALDALNGLEVDGCRLEVSLIKVRRRRRS